MPSRFGTGRDDPLSRALAPPPNETSEEKAQREAGEAKAKANSEEIDRQLLKDKDALAKRRIVKLLLLGAPHRFSLIPIARI